MNRGNNMCEDEIEEQINDLAQDKFNYINMYFNPKKWYQKSFNIRKWEVKKFPPNHRRSIPNKSGVYVFVVEPNIFGCKFGSGLLYIGKATSLYNRISAYVSEIKKSIAVSKRPHIWRMINQWDGHLKYYFTVTDNVEEAEELEEEMIRAYIPYFNREFDAETSQKVRAF